MPGLLEGIKVVSTELMEAVPVASLWMADWGAEVIKIEPISGDALRDVWKPRNPSGVKQTAYNSVNWPYQLINRNKKGMALDLKKEEGRNILYKLIQKADVFMCNYQVNSLQRLKLDYDTLSKLNPGLIYALISGYGSKGPDKDSAGLDWASGWSRSGWQDLLREPDGPPLMFPVGAIDRGIAAPHLLAGILAALLYRERTGKGQRLEVSLFQSSVWTIALPIQNAIMGIPTSKYDHKKAANPLAGIYHTKDNRWIVLAMLWPDPYWHGFCQAIDRLELENNPRFNSKESRAENCEELIRIIDEIFATKTMKEWDTNLRKYNLMYSLVQNPSEVIDDPQALENDFFVELAHPAGKAKTLATPVKFYQNPASIRSPAPEIGQHNEEILLGLGYSRNDIARLKDQGVIP